MRIWKILSNIFLIVLLAFTASGVVSANLASEPQNFGLESRQGQSLFSFLLCEEKSDYSTTNMLGCFVVGKRAVQANKAKGDAFRDEIADLMRKEGRDVQTEITKQTPFGKRVIDTEVSKDGKVLGGIETKAGNSRYTPSQRAKDEWLRRNDYPVDLVRDR